MPPSPISLHGLTAAPHTPFDAEGNLRLEAVEEQAALLRRDGVRAVFVGGSTGEFASLTFDERDALARRWIEVGAAHQLQVVVHVGGNAVEAGAELARRATGADAIAALSPFYFRPAGVDPLVASCAVLANAAPDLPFFYYDIPALTGVQIPAREYLGPMQQAIPSLAGIKYTSTDLAGLQLVLDTPGLEGLHGNDESLLAGLALGIRGAVGSTYNLAPGPYLRLTAAFRGGDLEAARREQLRSVRMVYTLVGFGYLGAAKATMRMLGVDVGAPRQPVDALAADQEPALRAALEELGFFEWRTAPEIAESQDGLW